LIDLSLQRRGLILGSAAMLTACGSGGSDNHHTGGTIESSAEGLPIVLDPANSQPKGLNSTQQQLWTALLNELQTCKNMVLRWNGIAIDATSLDHTPLLAGENRVFGEQLGPCRTSRALSMVHIAMYDALQSIAAVSPTFYSLSSAPVYTDLRAAIAQSAHDTLLHLYPSQRSQFNAALSADLSTPCSYTGLCVQLGLLQSDPRAAGLRAGQLAAATCIAARTGDGSALREQTYGVDFTPKSGQAIWAPDPVTNNRRALGSRWGEVKPFVMQSASQFRVNPPAPGSSIYARDYAEVQDLGGDGNTTPTRRTADQTEAGYYWAYDGVPKLGVPPRLYNQIATQLAQQQGLDTLTLTRLLMQANVSMADAALACWESKYVHQFWRPVYGLRVSMDGISLGSATPNFLPLGAPASNNTTPNFTPPFPAYPSGHAAFGAALFQTLRNTFGRDDIAFTFVSDEFNGVTKNRDGSVRPLKPRSFANLTQAELENSDSRIWLGVHWRFDCDDGNTQGRQVANWVAANT
jgi:hypothetical protein